MSRRALAVLAGGSSGGGSVTPGPPPSPPVAAGYSTAIPTLDQCAAVYQVGPSRTFTTIKAAMDHARAAITNTTANWRIAYVLDAGSYHEQLALANFDVLVAAQPGTVTIHHECPTGGSPVNTAGACYIGGMTLHLDDDPNRTGTAVYGGIHQGGNPGTQIFEQIVMGSIGSDLSPYGGTYLIGCTVGSGGINMHSDANAPGPVRVCWVNSTVAGPVSLNSYQNVQPDELWFVGANASATSWSLVGGYGAAAIVHMHPGIPMAAGSTTPASVAYSDALPPMPVRGIVPA